MVNQTWGLAETLGYEVEFKKIRIRRPWTDIAQLLGLRLSLKHCLHKDGDPLSSPYPDLVIASGRRSILPALALKEKVPPTCKLIYSQDPRMDPVHFDAVICPEHDEVFGKNVVKTLGATHRVTAEKLAQAKIDFQHLNPTRQPVFSVIIGGTTHKKAMKPESMARLVADLSRLSRQGWRVLVTLSRRTPPKVAQQFKASSPEIYVWDGTGENPYFGVLALADALLVTCDSVSMISEACATPAPVYIYRLPKIYWKHQKFHHSLIKLGRVSWWDGEINLNPAQPLLINEEAARRLRQFLDV
jgi:uncharacterized protein